MRDRRNRSYQNSKRVNKALSAVLIAGMIGSSTFTAFAETETFKTEDAVIEETEVRAAAEEEAAEEIAEEAAAVEAAAETEEGAAAEEGAAEEEAAEEEAAEEGAAEEEAAEAGAAEEEAVIKETEIEVPRLAAVGGIEEESAYAKADGSVAVNVTAAASTAVLTLTADAGKFDKFLYVFDEDGSLEGLEGDALYEAILSAKYRTAGAASGSFRTVTTAGGKVYVTAVKGEVDSEDVKFAKNVASAEITLTNPVYTYDTNAGIGARSATDANGNVYLGGNYIELGLSKYGSFGTVNESEVQKNFHNTWFLNNTSNASGDNGRHVGLICDGDGWNQGEDPTDGDFFVPGSPFEAWELSYELEGESGTECKVYSVAALSNSGRLYGSWSEAPTTVDTSDLSANKLSAKTTGTTADGLAIELVYEFDADSKFYNTKVSLANESGKSIKNVKFSRTFDPDQDEWFTGSYRTYNKVICNADPEKEAGATNYSMVVARGCSTLDGFFFIALDNRAVALNNAWGVLSQGYDWDEEQNRYVYGYEELVEETSLTRATEETLACSKTEPNGYSLADTGIGILFNIGDMEADGTDSLQYYSSLDPNVIQSFDDILVEEGIDAEALEELVMIEAATGLHGTGKSFYFEADIDGTFVMPALKDSVVVEEGYEFIGWKLNDDDSKVYYVGEAAEVDGNSKIVAQYRKKAVETVITTPVTAEKLGEQDDGTIKEVDMKDGNFSSAGLGTETAENLEETFGITVGEDKYNVWLKTEDVMDSPEADAIARYLSEACEEYTLREAFNAEVFGQKNADAPFRLTKDDATGKVYAKIVLTDKKLIEAALQGKLGIACMVRGRIEEMELECYSFNADTNEFTFELIDF